MVNWHQLLYRYTFTLSFLTQAGRTVGAAIVNRIRLLLTARLLKLIHFVTSGHFLPLSVKPEHWFWLGFSGIVGLVLGDAVLFQAFIWIGPHVSMLMMSLAQVFATILLWFFLKETLRIWQIIEILLTMGGIIWVTDPVPGIAFSLLAVQPAEVV